MRYSVVSCQCYSFMCHFTLRFPFLLVRNFRLCAISLCDFQLFPVFDFHECAHPHCELHLILVIILACTLYTSIYLIMIVTQLLIFELNKVLLESIIISSTLIHINCIKNLSKDYRQTVTCSKQNMLGSVIRPRRPARAPPSSPVREIKYYKPY